jgi:hypothetical protein
MTHCSAAMNAHPSPSLWDKIDYSLVTTAVTTADGSTPSTGTDQIERWGRFWRFRRPFLDAVASFLWLLALMKLVVIDLDRVLLGDAAEYRFFFFVGLTVVFVLVLRRPGPIAAGIAYVAAFPAIIACWKVPKFFIRTRSAVAFLAAVNVLSSVVANFKRSAIAGAGAIFSALVIVASHSAGLLGVAGAVMALLAAQAVYRTIKYSVQPSRFLRMQQTAIRKAVASKTLRELTSPTEELRRADLERFNETQQNDFIQKLANGVIAHRILFFWAYQLERYRRSPASVFFNSLAYAWLIVCVVVSLAFINLALYHADHTAYDYKESPGFLVLVRYVISGLYGGEIDALHPASNAANALSITAFVIGVVVLGSLLLSSALSFRAAKNESEIRETIAEIKAEGQELNKVLKNEYDVSVAEAVDRLKQLRFGLIGIITFLSTRIPEEFDNENGIDA